MIATKYLLTLAASFLAWIVPVNIPQTPKPIVLFSFLASGSGYLYALSLATPLERQRWFNEQQAIQDREVLLHDFALGELVLKQALELQYLGQAEVEPEEVEPEQQHQLTGADPKALPAALPDHLKIVIAAAKQNGGRIKLRDAYRLKEFANKVKAQEMQNYFHELQNAGWGRVVAEGKSVVFVLSR